MISLLLVGSGGREHALAWKLAQSPRISRIVIAPGNDGMPSEWERWNVSLSEGQSAFRSLAQRAQKEKIDLAVIGPDNPLAEGIVDIFEEYGIPTMGPSAAAAQIEASKAFAKDIMKSAGVPTAQYWVVESEEEARKILKSVPWPVDGNSAGGWVVKADGLALGKGVRVCDRLEDALQAVRDLFPLSNKLGPNKLVQNKLVIEEKLIGEELSWLAFCDGESCALMEPARDYKRLRDLNEGPNTGGMGAISPVPGVPDTFAEKMRQQVFLPVLREMKKRGAEFRGILYAGLMVDFKTGKFWVLEFNARFGDPETQVLMPRIEGDLYPWCEAVAKRNLKSLPSIVPFKKEYAVFVVGAASGYPDQPESGKRIALPEEYVESKTDSPYFFAGVKRRDQLYTAGGRVLGALGRGSDLGLARKQAYDSLQKVKFDGMQFRTDIGRLDP